MHFYFILFILSLILTVTEKIFTIKYSNEMLIDVNTLVKKPIEHRAFYKKRNKIK